MSAEQIQRNNKAFLFTRHSPDIDKGFILPVGYKIDNPINLSVDDWQNELFQFSQLFPDTPEGFLQSSHLTYGSARGIEEVSKDYNNYRIPSITIYAERSPGMLKNFFSAADWSIYFHAKWLARRAQLPSEENHKFLTEKTDEILFEGTPSAYATLIAMEEAQHALDFQLEKLKPVESEGMQYRSEKLVEHDSKKGELNALYRNLERMKNMPQTFSTDSLISIENRIISAEKYRHKHTFFLSRFLFGE